ncbi:MAG: class I SAM-dependent methyltransferase [Candidatus Heimdallarchaeota archaeon]|nr:MAG: class I SAM-dependent methyltransferase [Candidatus Heimdallarchaeota archaeon]
MVVDKGYEKAAHLYDLFDTKENIDFFFRYGKEAGVILDIGAGTGRIAIPLAKRGVKVVCIEPSPAMRNEFSQKLKHQSDLSDKITLIAGDVQSFELPEVFPAVFLSGSFDHIPDSERVTSLQNINRHLKLEGKLIFDVYIGGMKDSPLALIDTVKRGDYEYKRFIGTKTLPDDTIEVLLAYETYKQGKLIEKIEQPSSAVITTRVKVHELLHETGFSIKNEYGDYHFSPFKEGDSFLIIEAIKSK